MSRPICGHCVAGMQPDGPYRCHPLQHACASFSQVVCMFVECFLFHFMKRLRKKTNTTETRNMCNACGLQGRILAGQAFQLHLRLLRSHTPADLRQRATSRSQVSSMSSYLMVPPHQSISSVAGMQLQQIASQNYGESWQIRLASANVSICEMSWG